MTDLLTRILTELMGVSHLLKEILIELRIANRVA